MSEFGLLSFVRFWIVEFCQNLGFWLLLEFELSSFVTVWVSLQLSSFTIAFLLFFPLILWVFSKLKFIVLSQFEFWSLVTNQIVEFCHIYFNFLQFEFVHCHNLRFGTITVWVFDFCHNLIFFFFIWSQFDFLSLVTIWFFEFCKYLRFVTIWLFDFGSIYIYIFSFMYFSLFRQLFCLIFSKKGLSPLDFLLSQFFLQFSFEIFDNFLSFGSNSSDPDPL